MKKRILVCYEGNLDNNSSFRFRIWQYINRIEKEGFHIKLIYPYESKERLIFWFNFLKDLLANDLVFVEKTLLSPRAYFFIKLFNKKSIYDFDDALYANYTFDKLEPGKVDWRKALLIYNLKKVDCVIVSNKYLADFARKYNNNVTIIPTSLDFDLYNKSLEKKDKAEKIRIGWIGKSENLSYLDGIISPLRKICKEYPQVEIVIVSSKTYEAEGLKIKNLQWARDREMGLLANFDIGIMPLIDDEWTQGKSAFKAIQCMAACIPCVCSPIGFVTQVIKDGENGFLASGMEEWIEKLSILIENEALRKEMGMNARDSIKSEFSVEVNFPKLLSVVKSV